MNEICTCFISRQNAKYVTKLIRVRNERGTVVAQCYTNRKVAGSIPAGVNGFFIDMKSFRSHYGPGVDSVSNRNEYQEYFLGGKGGRYVRLTTLPPSCAVVMKSGSLNFLETSGPVQACNKTDLPFYLNERVQLSLLTTCVVCQPENTSL